MKKPLLSFKIPTNRKGIKTVPKLIVSILGCELIGLLAAPLTVSAIPTWYASLNKPSFAPPNWVFGPAWTLLYLLMGISFYFIWKQGFKKKTAKTAGKIFALQLGLNFLWTPLFFGLRSPILGLIDIVILLVAIGITIQKFYPLSRLAAYFLLPYFLWVSFATVLNAAIVLLNP